MDSFLIDLSMKITCSQNEFKTHFTLVSRAVSSRPTHPILSNILMAVDEEENTVTLTSFDLSLGIVTSFRCKVHKRGEITIPSKLIVDIIARLPEGNVTLSVDDLEDEEESVLIQVESESGKFQIRGMKSDEFPSLPFPDGDGCLKLPVSAFLDGLKNTIFSASSDETKQILTGVHLTGRTDSLEFAATDGHRLSVVESNLEESVEDLDRFSLTIPARSLSELQKMIITVDKDETITVNNDESIVHFEVGNQRLITRTLEGSYPNYHQLLPSSFSRRVVFDRKKLIQCLELVAVLANEKSKLVKFIIDAETGEVTLSVEAQDVGNAKQVLSAEIQGDSLEIGFNIKYLMDGIKAISSSDLQMSLNEGNQPVILTPLGGLKMVYLVMPVQVIR